MNKSVRYLLAVAAIALVGYNSVYIKKLDEVKKGASSAFDAGQYADNFWKEKLIPALPEKAVDLTSLLNDVNANPEKTFKAHAHALGIGNIGFFLVKGAGKVSEVGPDDIALTLTGGQTVRLATEYIYSNAVRDASGLILITEFENTGDLNNVAKALNEKVRAGTVPLLKQHAKVGATIRFIGAVELNKAHLHTDKLTIIPIQTK